MRICSASVFLLLLDSFQRAGSGAGAALHTLVGVDDILVVALGDDAEGAGIGAGAALCAGVSDEICHGIPSPDRVLKDGDIINVDVSTIYNGYYSDASRMFMIGNVSEEAKRLVEVTKECLYKA